MNETPIRWGVAATGNIAARFVEDLGLLDDATVVAVASRSAENAERFGDRFDIPRRHASYAALAEDPDVDVVYVASPHSGHAEDTVRLLEGGKHVLCEKPFALNERQVSRMIETARRRGLFLMEALWTRFLPAYVAMRDVLSEGRIGEPLFVEGDFGFRVPVDAAHRLFDRALGGGALLDLGIYPLQLASEVLGPAEVVHAAGQLGETGVDEAVVVVLRHGGGAMSVSKAAIRVTLACRARIAGSEGAIEIPPLMHCPDHLTVRAGFEEVRIDAPFDGNGLRFQAREVHRCIRSGLLESPMVPLEESRRLARLLDAARAQYGLRYPADDEAV